MTLQTRSTWLVSSQKAKYDLDNILLKDIASYDEGVEAVFQLDHLLVEGSIPKSQNTPQVSSLQVVAPAPLTSPHFTSGQMRCD